MGFMEDSIVIMVAMTSIAAGTPILLAAIGEIIGEKSGVLNLGLEGIMLMGAVASYFVVYNYNNPILGVIVALFLTGLMGLFFAFLTVTLRAEQIVSGLSITIFGMGFAGYVGKFLHGTSVTLFFQKFPLQPLSNIPAVGRIFFNQDIIVYLSYMIVLISWFYLNKTKIGLHLRSVGESASTADSLGLNVFLIRYVNVILGSMLAGLAGVFIALVFAPYWSDGITAGRGWIAIALVIFSGWNPFMAMLGAYLFGIVEALIFHLQVLDTGIPSYFLRMLPYLATIFVLIITTKSKGSEVGISKTPSDLMIPYVRESK